VQRTILRRAGMIDDEPSLLTVPIRPALDSVSGYRRVRPRSLMRPA
jgi:hypothetical protein